MRPSFPFQTISGLIFLVIVSPAIAQDIEQINEFQHETLPISESDASILIPFAVEWDAVATNKEQATIGQFLAASVAKPKNVDLGGLSTVAGIMVETIDQVPLYSTTKSQTIDDQYWASYRASSDVSIDQYHALDVSSDFLINSVNAFNNNPQAVAFFQSNETIEAFNQVYEHAMSSGSSIGLIPRSQAMRYWMLSRIISAGPEEIEAYSHLTYFSIDWCMPPIIRCRPSPPTQDMPSIPTPNN